jgi:alpha-1,2-mannosyltransferase
VTVGRQSAVLPARPAETASDRHGVRLLRLGTAAFAVTVAGYVGYISAIPGYHWMNPVDLRVYADGGLVVRHVAPFYRAHRAAPLYGWPGFENLKFTYPPFAAMAFTILTLAPFLTVASIWVAVNIAALVATVWMTFGGLGYRRGLVRMGATLLLAAPLFLTEPVQRTLYLGQIEIVLMALIIWDQCQPDRRWWKGAGIGLAAGIKLVPLVFIPYLVLTRRFRQAAVAAGTFALTVLLGFAVLPRDSGKYWLDGLFTQGGRTGFVGWEGNQSLRAIVTRFIGSVAAAQPVWLVIAVAVAAAGAAAAAILDRAGHRMVGLLTCALTGLLISPISWDHHWVWIAPATVVAAVYAVRARRSAARWALAGVAAGLVLVFGAWPGSFWSLPAGTGGFFEGLIWIPPVTNPETYLRLGDRRWYVEYHWHGMQLIAGNLYVLAGMALFAALLVLALRSGRPGHRPPGRGRPGRRRPAHVGYGSFAAGMRNGGSAFHAREIPSQIRPAAAASRAAGAR